MPSTERPFGLFVPIVPLEVTESPDWRLDGYESWVAANGTLLWSTNPQLWSLVRALDAWRDTLG